MRDSCTAAESANVLPDGTTIVDVTVSMKGATGPSTPSVIVFCNLTSNRAFGNPDSGSNASPGLEEFDSNRLFDSKFEPAGALHSGILSAGLELDEMPGSFAIAPDAPDTEASDNAALALAGIGFALAGTVGRGSKASQRLNAPDDRHAGLESALDIAF